MINRGPAPVPIVTVKDPSTLYSAMFKSSPSSI